MTAKWRKVIGALPRTFKMGMSVASVKVLARLGLAMLLVGSLAMPAAPSAAAPFGNMLAAPFRNLHHFQFGDSGPFDVDPDPCGVRRGRFRGEQQGACAGQQRRVFPRGNGGPHAPGSNAFGLQFDYGGY